MNHQQSFGERPRPPVSELDGDAVGPPSAETSLGRPRRILNHDEVRRLRAEGASIRQIAAKLGVGYGTVRRTLPRV